MKLKRFLAIVISLAMVLSIVPAFSLTVGAADFSSDTYAVDEYLVFDGSYSAVQAPSALTSVASVYEGWTGNYYGYYGQNYNQSNTSSLSSHSWSDENVSRQGIIATTVNGQTVNMFQFTKVNGNVWSQYYKENAPTGGYATNSKVMVVEWMLGCPDTIPNALYGGFNIYDVDGKSVFYVLYDKNDSNNYTTKGAKYRFSVVNDAANNTYDWYYEENTGSGYTLKNSGTNVSGQVNGFGGFSMSRCSYNTDSNYIGIGDIKIYAELYTDTQVTVNYVDTADGSTADSYTTTGYVGTEFTPHVTGSYYASETTGYLYTVGTPGTITVAEENNTVTIPVTKYKKLTSGNLITNGSFENADNDEGWTTGTGKGLLDVSHSFVIDTAHATDGQYALYAKNDSYVGAGFDTDYSLVTKWDLAEDKNEYFFAVDAMQEYKSNNPYGYYATYASDGTENSRITDSTLSSTERVKYNETEMTQYPIFFTADGAAKFGYNVTWMQDAFVYYDNFQLYAIEALAESNAATVQAAVDGITIATLAKNSITLPSTVNDGIGDFDVTWTSSNTDVLSNAGVVGTVDTITTVTLTPSVEFDNTTYTGAAHTVTVFPNALATTTYKDGDTYYKVGETNLITEKANSDFSGENWDNGWTTGTGAALSTGFTRTTDGDVNYVTAGANNGSGGANSLITTFTGILTQGSKYLLRYQTKDVPNDGNTAYRFIGYPSSDANTNTIAAKTDLLATTGSWETKTFIFDAAETDLKFNFCWQAGSAKYTGFELYELTTISHTVTLNIKGTDGNVVKTLTKNGLEGDTVTFDAQSFAANGAFYTTEAQSYTVGAADATYEITATADTSKIATTNDFSYNFNTGAVIWAGDNGFNSANKTGTISIGWDNLRETIMTFPLPVHTGELISGIDLNVNVGFASPDSAAYTVYAIDPTLVGDGTMDPQITGYSYSDLATVVAQLGGSQVGSAKVSKGWNTITLDLSSVGPITETELALLITTSNQVYTYSATTSYPPYLSSTYTTISSVTYTVNYVDESSNTIKEATTVDYAPGTQYGYNNEVICPNLAIPAIDGYIFRKKSVSGTTITLTYREVQTTDYFFDNITNMNTRFISLNMLGAHNAITGNMTERYDAAGCKQGDKGSNAACAYGTGINVSKTQSLDTLGLLEEGTRYFDIRLSRSDEDVTASYKLALITYSNTAPHTNGVFYTTHGLLGEELEPVLYTIEQWVESHPGEIVVLDFQEVWDSTNGRDGNGSGDSGTWTAINNLLTKTGINDHVVIGEGSIKDITYGDLTENGKKGGIVLIGRHGAKNIGKFLARGTGGTLNFDGKVYSYYKDTEISTSYSASYIQTQVDYMNNFTAGDHPIFWMYRVMQGQSESKTNLLTQASSDNKNLYSGLKSNPEWLTALPVVSVNGVGSNTDDIYTLLKECNVPTETVKYVYNGTVVKSVPNAALVGTLYTNDGFYDEPIYKLVNDGNGEYYVSETFYTNHNNNTITKVVKGSAVEVDVTKLGNVYTIQHDDSADSNVVKVYSGGIDNFSAFFWGGDNTDHRTGVAIVDATDSSAYQLTATQFRDTVYDGSNTVRFYVVSYEDFINVDLTDYSAFKALLTDTNKAAYFTSKTYNDSTEKSYETVLDANVVKKAIGESGKVVIIGDSLGGLYGLKNDISIVSCYVVESTTEGVTTTTVVKPDGTYILGPAKVYEDADSQKLYAPGSSVTVNSDMTFNGHNTLGADIIKGAQVRIGSGVDANGKIPAEGGSGLRFITTVNGIDTIAGLKNITEIGVRITAEDSSSVVDIATADDKWQTTTVFTSALTNLKESNYNRKFTATPYVKYIDTATGDEVVVLADTSVTRSIYQVAAGLLAKASTDGTDYDDTALASQVLYKVLNAYVNQTGIRLQINEAKNGLEVYSKGTTSDYSGDVFFEVTDTTCVDNIYTIAIKPVGEKTTINSYWQEYIRINNNNSAIAQYTSLVDNGDGTVTITFNYAQYLADKAA